MQVTVKDTVQLLSGAKGIGISWGGMVTPIDPDSDLDMEAYGDFVVSKILPSHNPETYELLIKTCPVKASAAGEL